MGGRHGFVFGDDYAEANRDVGVAPTNTPPEFDRKTNKTLVLADSPNKLTGAATLKKAIAQRDTLMGGWGKVIVLGWNFESSIGHDIQALNDPQLEVLVIPPDLLDRLKKKGGLEKLKGTVRFASLQYLTIKPVRRAGALCAPWIMMMLTMVHTAHRRRKLDRRTRQLRPALPRSH